MNVKHIVKNVFLAVSLISVSAADAAFKRYNDSESGVMLREINDSLDTLRHEVNNHEAELRTFEERINNQDTILSSLRQQVLDATQANKDLLKGNNSSIETKLHHLESTSKSLISDLSQLKSHANESATLLGQFRQKFLDMDKLVELQNRNIENLQTALNSLMEAIQGNEQSLSKNGEKKYKIKAGDSLEKIARAHGISVKAIKELNKMSSDRIIIGQTILLP